MFSYHPSIRARLSCNHRSVRTRGWKVAWLAYAVLLVHLAAVGRAATRSVINRPTRIPRRVITWSCWNHQASTTQSTTRLWTATNFLSTMTSSITFGRNSDDASTTCAWQSSPSTTTRWTWKRAHCATVRPDCWWPIGPCPWWALPSRNGATDCAWRFTAGRSNTTSHRTSTAAYDTAPDERWWEPRPVPLQYRIHSKFSDGRDRRDTLTKIRPNCRHREPNGEVTPSQSGLTEVFDVTSQFPQSIA